MNKYLYELEQLRFEDNFFLNYQKILLSYDFGKSDEETFAWICCVLALKAASLGNLAVGAILVRENQVIHEACNEMLHPYFRSDGHPEMMVLSEYEAGNTVTPGSMRAIAMYTSLEPCPMCLTRASTTGIGAVKYIAAHPGSGMANSIDKLPALWQVFCEDLNVLESSCSGELKRLSTAILNQTAKMQVPKILTYKEGQLSEKRMECYLKNLE